MRILLTRPEADAKRSAKRLAALGHEVLIAPLFEIVPTGAPAPEGHFDQLLATSAHAFEGLGPHAQCLKQPLHVVGERTAAAARASGLTQVERVEPDAKTLAISIARALRRPQTFLYLAGRDRRPELEASLAALGHAVTPWIVYESREADAARLTQIWRDESIDAVLHFSPRSAALYVALAQAAGLATQALAPIQIAISPRAAQDLSAARDIRIAPKPDLDGLISCL